MCGGDARRGSGQEAASSLRSSKKLSRSNPDRHRGRGARWAKCGRDRHGHGALEEPRTSAAVWCCNHVVPSRLASPRARRAADGPACTTGRQTLASTSLPSSLPMWLSTPRSGTLHRGLGHHRVDGESPGWASVITAGASHLPTSAAVAAVGTAPDRVAAGRTADHRHRHPRRDPHPVRRRRPAVPPAREWCETAHGNLLKRVEHRGLEGEGFGEPARRTRRLPERPWQRRSVAERDRGEVKSRRGPDSLVCGPERTLGRSPEGQRIWSGIADLPERDGAAPDRPRHRRSTVPLRPRSQPNLSAALRRGGRASLRRAP